MSLTSQTGAGLTTVMPASVLSIDKSGGVLLAVRVLNNKSSVCTYQSRLKAKPTDTWPHVPRVQIAGAAPEAGQKSGSRRYRGILWKFPTIRRPSFASVVPVQAHSAVRPTIRRHRSWFSSSWRSCGVLSRIASKSRCQLKLNRIATLKEENSHRTAATGGAGSTGGSSLVRSPAWQFPSQTGPHRV